jgi:GRF zinc finger
MIQEEQDEATKNRTNSSTTTTISTTQETQYLNRLLSDGTNQKASSGTTNRITAHGTDIVDDFIDGIYHTEPKSNHHMTKTTSAVAKKSKLSTSTAKSNTTSVLPLCTGHQQPCKSCTVKKTGPNKGRKFYVCASTSRIEQCTTFIWVDDTVQVRSRFFVFPTDLYTKSFPPCLKQNPSAFLQRTKTAIFYK